MRASCPRFKFRGPDAVLMRVQLPRLRWATDSRREEELSAQRLTSTGVAREIFPVNPDDRPALISSTDDFRSIRTEKISLNLP